mmetsp:Transcript_7055/g.6878  ORF Transcript_7055/g.6878 Transcript_7055/m.6878 type:complete len:100 (-) Transcript_7055:1235-1534(-)
MSSCETFFLSPRPPFPFPPDAPAAVAAICGSAKYTGAPAPVRVTYFPLKKFSNWQERDTNPAPAGPTGPYRLSNAMPPIQCQLPFMRIASHRKQGEREK